MLSLPTRRRLLSDDRGLPVGEEDLAGTADDFWAPRPIGGTVLDTAFTDLVLDADGHARTILEDPASGRRLTLWTDGEFRYLMVFTGDTLQPPTRRRRSVAVEPMTCPPDALRSGRDLVALEPGGQWRGTWGINPFEARPSDR